MAKRSMKMTARFALVLVVVVPALLAVAWAGFHGLQTGRNRADGLYTDNVISVQNAASLDIALEDAHQASLELLLADSPAEKQRITAQLLSSISPAVEGGITTVLAESRDNPDQLASVKVISAGWNQFQQLLAGGGLTGGTPAAQAVEAKQVTANFDVTTAAAKSIAQVEGLQAEQAHRQAQANYRVSVQRMLLAVMLGLLAVVGVVIWLIRSVLTRTLAYSAFAADVTQGDYAKRLSPGGGDELADLGRTLDALAQRRQGEDAYDRTQLDFTDALQQTETEQEAHNLLKRHLERSVPSSSATVLNRNNSADRLQAVTLVAPESPLIVGLEAAKPRSCLAVRMARPHSGVHGEDRLLSCPVCSGCPGETTCTPLLLGGEVIGSVLVNHDQPLADAQQRSIRDAVIQAAPVLGNLRNLAIAELRAATDGLTGLPNKRALHDTVKRMVAQSSRTLSPLAALMCDLDHFKQINDRFGHGRGDDVLAAVGAALHDTLRDSDFAGRYGGEEFLILLPATDTEGAVAIAEKVRFAVATIRVPTVEQPITLSVGIAVIPDHAVDADSLERAADRALYFAKQNGRDRTEIFTTHHDGSDHEYVATQPTGTTSTTRP